MIVRAGFFVSAKRLYFFRLSVHNVFENNIRTEFLRNFRRRKFSLLVFATYFHAAKRYKRGGNNPKAFDCFEMKKNTWTSVIKHNLLQHSILFTCVDFQELSWKKHSNFSVNRGMFPAKFKSLGNLRDDFNSDGRHMHDLFIILPYWHKIC